MRATPGGGSDCPEPGLSWRPRPALPFPAAWRTWEIKALGCPGRSGWRPRIGVPPLAASPYALAGADCKVQKWHFPISSRPWTRA